ncbi:hypothetical protein AAC387_Pa06g1936 [Persea americana]
MVQTLKSIHEGGGSIIVGTTGTISNLMTKEMDSLKQIPESSTSSRKKPQTAPVSVPCGAIPRKSLQKRNPANEASSSNSNNNSNNTNNNISSSSHRNPGNTQKSKSDLQKNDHHIPMLRSGDVSTTDGKANREKSDKKGPNIVEVVDLKCGHPDRTWSSPITNRLKKLSFSKLSENVT